MKVDMKNSKLAQISKNPSPADGNYSCGELKRLNVLAVEFAKWYKWVG
jgi:hypothetical protein